MAERSSWEDLANEFEEICNTARPLAAKWFAYAGSENHGIWLLSPNSPETEEVRATLSLLAARAVEKLGLPLQPTPEPLQHCPHWGDYCAIEEEMARRAGQQVDLSRAVPYGLETIDGDAVDPCSRTWLELLRRERIGLLLSENDEVVKGTSYRGMTGIIRNVCRASAVCCKRCAREEIRAALMKRTQSEVTVESQKKRGRPPISDQLKLEALEVKGGKARAEILYGTKRPTPQQVKNQSTILRHFKKTHPSHREMK